MRTLALLLIGCMGLLPDRAAAQQASASGTVGAGVFGTEAAAAADLGLDVIGNSYALGLGARVRWLASDGLRTEDWDEPSEWAAVLRYLTYTRSAENGDVAASVAAGSLGSVDLGHGAVIRGYTAGIDVDHRRLGVQLRVAGQRYGAEGLVDDVVSPRIAGVRGYWNRHALHHALEAGLSLAADRAAPAQTVTGAAMVPMTVLDGSAGVHTRDQTLSGAIHADLVALVGLAAGVHLGSSAEILARGSRVSARAELQVGTDGYIPGWIGPLYERDRRALGTMGSQLDVARMARFGHVGSFFELDASHPDLGEASVSYARRPGLADLLVARMAAPAVRHVQGALWAALEPAGSAGAFALELRVPLPGQLFLSFEAARLYREQDGMLAPWWLATASVGGTLVPADSTSLAAPP